MADDPGYPAGVSNKDFADGPDHKPGDYRILIEIDVVIDCEDKDDAERRANDLAEMVDRSLPFNGNIEVTGVERVEE